MIISTIYKVLKLVTKFENFSFEILLSLQSSPKVFTVFSFKRERERDRQKALEQSSFSCVENSALKVREIKLVHLADNSPQRKAEFTAMLLCSR